MLLPALPRLLAAALFLMWIAAESVAQQSWKPARNVELIVGVGPGGGVDRTARTLQRILLDKRMLEVSATVVNKPGGGGTLGLNYLNQHPGDAHFLEISATSLLTNQITGRTASGWNDYTPLAMLYDEFIGFVVRADSPLKNARDLAALLKQDTAAIATGIASSAGNTNHIALALLARHAGGDVKKLRVVVFGSGAESTTALLGGHVGLVATPAATAAGQVLSGAVRMLAIAAPRRVAGRLSSVPTLSEQGYDVVVANWRPAIGPRGLSGAQIAYWENVIERFTQTEEWQRELDATGGVNHYMNSRELGKFFAAQHAEFKSILSDLGLAK